MEYWQHGEEVVSMIINPGLSLWFSFCGSLKKESFKRDKLFILCICDTMYII